MKKGLLVYRINRDDPANSGVIKKCKAQKKAFEQNGIQVDMLWLCKDGVLKNDALILKRDIPPHSWKVYRFYFLEFGKILSSEVLKGDYDFIYLRHPFFDPLLVRSLRKIKKAIPKIKTFLEINTYPYDSEPKRWLHKLSLKMDQYYRKTAHEFIDRIVDYGVREKIWGIPTISIRNGIGLDEIPLSRNGSKEGKLRMIAVGNWSYWHGLDRVLEGLKNYYQQGRGEAVFLKIVGGGEAIESSKEFVKENSLENYVSFFSPRFGKELDQIFDDADIGIGTLGLHRKSVALNSSLKHRSYCTRGIPFILSGNDPDFPEKLDFVKYFESKDEVISIEEINLFFKKIKNENTEYQKEMRDYAERQLTWEKKILRIIEAF